MLRSHLPLHHAVSHNATQRVKAVLQDEPECARQRDAQGNTALHLAARGACAAILRAVVHAAPDMACATNNDGDLPLHLAAIYGNESALEVLLSAEPAAVGAVGVPNAAGRVPLHLAVGVPNAAGRVPLHLAAACTRTTNAVAAFDTLYRAGPKLMTAVDARGDTPLHLAARVGNVGVVHHVLCEYPGAMLVANHDGMRALHLAVASFVSEDTPAMTTARPLAHAIAAMLKRAPWCTSMAELEHASNRGHEARPSVLHMAAYHGTGTLVRVILKRDPGAAMARNVAGETALHLAALHGYAGISRMLLAAAPLAVNVLSVTGETALHCATQSTQGEVVRLLLAASPGAAAMATTEGRTPAFLAAASYCTDGLAAILEVSPGTAAIPDNDGVLPVHAAAMHGHHEAVDMLLRLAPHTATARTPDGRTLLHLAAEQHLDNVAGVVMRHAPQIARARTPEGYTALEVSLETQSGLEDMEEDMMAAGFIRVLLKRNPTLAEDVILPNHRAVPLHAAATLGLEQCVRVLLEFAPGTTWALDASGHTPVHLALAEGHVRCARMLLDAPGPGALEKLRALQAFRAPGAATSRMFCMVIKRHMPMSPECWALVPPKLPGVLGALPLAVHHGARLDVRALFSRMLGSEQAFVLSAMSCLRGLPSEIAQTILAHAI